MSFRSLPEPGSESPRSLTIGSDAWLLSIIVVQSLFLVGPSTDRAAAGRLRPQTNFLTLRWLGLEIQIHGSERGGRKARDSRSCVPSREVSLRKSLFHRVLQRGYSVK